jgi:hypothetical protein
MFPQEMRQPILDLTVKEQDLIMGEVTPHLMAGAMLTPPEIFHLHSNRQMRILDSVITSNVP